MPRVSIQQAAQTALQVYLQNEFAKSFGGPGACVVNDRWPEPDSPLPERAVTILPAGAREDLHIQEQDIRREDRGTGIKPVYTWRVTACRQPLQIDIWSKYEAQRDELLSLLDDALHQGEAHTLGVPNGNPVRDGVLLALDPNTGYQGFADFLFEGPRKLDSTNSARQREYRASLLGFVDVDLTLQTQTAQLARVLVKVALDPLTDEQAANSPDLTFTMNTQTGDVAVTGS